MKLLSKDEGKAMIKLYPQYICRTQHKRHYYIEESRAAMNALQDFRMNDRDKIIMTYPETEG